MVLIIVCTLGSVIAASTPADQPRRKGGSPPFDGLRVTGATFVMVSLSNHGCPIEDLGHDGLETEKAMIRTYLKSNLRENAVIPAEVYDS
jgi:hypothetical protein